MSDVQILKPVRNRFLSVTHRNNCPVILSQNISECICEGDLKFIAHNDSKWVERDINLSRKARREAERQAARATKKSKNANKGGAK
jgi:hypothetical protein